MRIFPIYRASAFPCNFHRPKSNDTTLRTLAPNPFFISNLLVYLASRDMNKTLHLVFLSI